MTMENTIDILNIGGTAEVAEILNCPKQQIHSLRKNLKFPRPIHNIAATPLWKLSDVEVFKQEWKRRGSRTKAVEAPQPEIGMSETV